MARAAEQRLQGAWAAVTQHRECWAVLDPDVVERVARLPFVILDVQFTNQGWWHQVATVDAPAGDEQVTAASPWSVGVAGPLMLETLICAWHIAKWDRRVALLSLGMTLPVAEVVSHLSPWQLTSISARHGDALRLRWHDNPQFWARIFSAARSRDDDALREIQLHAKLLVTGELMSAAAVTRASP